MSAGGESIDSVQLRRLLARFIVARNAPIPTAQLVETLWGEHPPSSARNSLQSKISRLRSLVGADRLVLEHDAYRLVALGDVVDCDRFESLCALTGTAASVPEAIELFDEALDLWHGAAYGEFEGDGFAQAEATRLEALRRSAEDRRLALVAAESPDQALSESGKLLARDPFRESAWIVKLRALADIGRRVEALRAFHEYRTRLAEETGLTPSPQLVALERALLDAEAVPLADSGDRPTRMPAPAEVSVETGIPWIGPVRANRSLVGREREAARLDEALDAALAGSARLVILTGEAGIGKTRLLDEVVQRATRRGFDVLRGSAL